MAAIRIFVTMLFVSLFLLSCGSSSDNTDSGDSKPDNQSYETIKSYIEKEGNSTIPTVEEYTSLGITGVNEENIEEINYFLLKYITVEYMQKSNNVKELLDSLMGDAPIAIIAPNEVVQYRTIALEINNATNLSVEKVEWLDEQATIFDDNISATYHAMDQVGTQRVVVRILFADGSVALDTIEIETLLNTNKFTKIFGTPQLSLHQDEEYSFTPQTLNEDDDPLNFYATNLPTWLRINIHTGQIEGTPSNSDVGVHKDVTIIVSDGKDPVALTPFDITVINVNDAPTITGTPLATTPEDSNFSFMPTVHDIDSAVDGNTTTLLFSSQNFPDWLSIDTQTGQISGVPDYQDVAVLKGLRISVSDGQKSASMEFDLEVVAVNDAPVMEALNQETLRVYEDSDVTLALKASDEENNSFSFSALNLPQWASLNAQTGVITGVPTNEFVGQSNLITLFVKDSYGAESNISFSFTVINTNDAPIFKNVTTLTAQEDAQYTFQIEVEDVDPDDLLVYSASNLPNWLYIRPADGEIFGIPANDDVGESQITLTVNDGNATVTQVFDLIVSNTNDAPTVSGEPTRSYTPATVDFKFMPTYRDVDMDVVDESLSYTLSNNPTWMSINPDTGEVYGRPSTHGFYSGIVVSVSDGEESVSLEPFDINVTPIKRALASGQTLEYSNHDDGTYRLKGAIRNFVASNDSVTLDSMGLIWQDSADVGVLKKQWLEPLNYYSNRHEDTSGDTAASYCEDLVLAGYSHWRLPTAQELMELSDKSKINPSLDTLFSYQSSGIFWSSTSYSFESDKAWSVNFAYGSNRWESKDSQHFVRCVHDDPFATTGYVEEYYKESNIVTHAKSALQWHDELYSSQEQNAYATASSMGKVASFEEAINYCEALSVDGYSDWRLPNFNELYLLVDRSKNTPAIDDAFANKPQGHYWSSTTVSWQESNGWVINFQYGNPEAKDKTQVAYVRCVRN